MRRINPTNLLGAAVALALISGCTSSSTYAPKPSMLRQMTRPGYHGAGYNTCPAKGAIAYVSDQGDGTINIFAGNFHGQAPCGILTIGHYALNGLMVKSGDLYVTKGPPFPQIWAFHRGETTPFMTYFDTTCGNEVASDVTVSDDGYVIASNFFAKNCSAGSISVWKRFTGALVANYPSASGLPIYFLTIQKDGTLYYDDTTPGLWVGKCIKGVCGAFSNTGAIFLYPGGIRSVAGEHIVLDDQNGMGGGRALTYTPPSFDSPSGSCSLGSQLPIAIDINFKENHIFVTDAGRGVAKEFKYPTGGGDGGPCVLIGSVKTTGGAPTGIAVARPESL